MAPIIPAGWAFPLDARARSGYNGGMARRKAKKRERPLGAAIGWGLAVTFGVALVILVVQLLIPNSDVRHLAQMSLYSASPTLRGDPLYQHYSDSVQEQEALFASPLSLLCGGLTLGWLAPRYVPRKRLLLIGAATAFGILSVSLLFIWVTAVREQNQINRQEGGYVYPLTAPPDLIVRQVLWAALWIAIGTGGTWLGLRLRDRKAAPAPPPLKAAR